MIGGVKEHCPRPRFSANPSGQTCIAVPSASMGQKQQALCAGLHLQPMGQSVCIGSRCMWGECCILWHSLWLLFPGVQILPCQP